MLPGAKDFCIGESGCEVVILAQFCTCSHHAHLVSRMRAPSATEFLGHIRGDAPSTTRQVINRGLIAHDEPFDEREAHECANLVHVHVKL